MFGLKKSFFPFLLLMVLFLASFVQICAGWSSEIRLTNISAYDGMPSIAQLQNGDIWVVWQTKRSTTTDIYYKIRYAVNGSWSMPSSGKLLFVSDKDDTSPFILQTRNGSLWVFWTIYVNANNDIVYRRSDDCVYWTPTRFVTNSDQNPADVLDDKAPSVLETTNGNLWVVWQRTIAGDNDDIYYKIYNGSTWSEATALTTSPEFDRNPSVVQAKNGSIIIFWTRFMSAEDFDIVYQVYTGSSWGPIRHLTQTPGLLSSDPFGLLTRTGAIWVTWAAQDVNNTGVPDSIFYKVSEDNGNTWSATSPVMASLNESNSQPAMAQGVDKRVWVVWQSKRDGNFEIYYKTSDELLYHDVAVADIRLSKTWAYQGWNVPVTVDVKNEGDYSETLTVRLYANDVLLGTQISVLSGGSSASLVYSWDTSSWAIGNYVMRATVDSVPNENTINWGDNTLTRGSMMLRIPGDINADSQVDSADLDRLNSAFSSAFGQPGWDYECDINEDGVVDTTDLFLLGSNYGRTA